MVKKSVFNARDPGSIPGLERSPGEGNGNPLQYSCLENLMDRGAWPAPVHGVAKSWTQLSDFSFSQGARCCVCEVSSVMSDSLWPDGLWPSRLLCPWASPGKNTGVGCHALLKGIFLTQELNPGLPHCGQILYCLSYQRSPWHANKCSYLWKFET